MSNSKKYRFPGPRPFKTDEADLFFGRTADSEQLCQQVLNEKMVLLYAKSGLGKSSLINAGLLPLLHKTPDYEILQVHFGNYNAFLKKYSKPLDVLIAQIPDNTNPSSEYLDKIIPNENSVWYRFKKQQSLTKDRTLIFIFDQFEELLTYPEEDIFHFKKQFSNLLFATVPSSVRVVLDRKLDKDPSLLTADELRLLNTPLKTKALFAIRSDRMSDLNHIADYFPNILKTFYELKPLTRQQAEEAIVEPARQPSEGFISPVFSFTKPLVEKIIQSLQDDGTQTIESFQLQMVCRFAEDLVVQEQTAVKGEVSEADLKDIPAIFAEYYQRILADIPAAFQRLVRTLIEEKLVVAGNRVPLPEVVIVQQEGIPQEIVDSLLNTHFLRAERNSVGGRSIELSHDTLVEPVQKAAELRLKKEEEKKKIELEKQIQKEKDRVRERDEALEKARKLIDAFYFYNDEVALAFKDKKFYFIKKNGEEVKYLGRWDKAEQFDDSGFAKVSIKDEVRQGISNNSKKIESNENNKSKERSFVELDILKKLNVDLLAKPAKNHEKIINKEISYDPRLWNIDKQFNNFLLANVSKEYEVSRGVSDNYKRTKPSELYKSEKTVSEETTFLKELNANQPSKTEDKNNTSTNNISTEKFHEFLLDIHGNSYKVCYDLKDLNNEVTALDLRGKYLEEFPQEIIKFTPIQILIIDGKDDKRNTFDTIPAEISRLKNLQYISFQFCKIKSFPDVLAGFNKLQKIILSNNELETIPETFYALTELDELNLTENGIKEVSEKISNLKKLKTLGLGGNKLSRLPDSFWEFYDLTDIGLWDNQLKEISASISNCSKLQRLYLGQNQLESIPESLYKLLELTELDLSGNLFREISKSIGKLSKLQKLYLNQNKLESIPETLYKLREMSELNLTENNIKELSDKIANLKKLKSLGLTGNKLSRIPDSFWRLGELNELYLWDNQIREISGSISKCSKLQKLYLDQNQLEAIPEALCELYQLTELGLSGNKIKAIPLCIDNLSKLQKLDLNQNQLESLPESLYDLKNLTELYLRENQLSWIKESIAKLEKLHILSLGGNKLSSLPDSFWGLGELTELYLWDNQLAEIPEFIGNLSKLQKLYLNQNQLESLPESLYDLKNLTELYLKENQLNWAEALKNWGKRLITRLDHLPKARIALENVIKQLQAEAQENLNGEKASEAIGLFEQALSLERELSRPENFATLNQELGDALLKADRLHEALEQLTGTIANESVWQNKRLRAELHSRLALVYFLLGNTASVQEHYQKALNLHRLQDTSSPGILIGEIWKSFISAPRQFWTLRDGLRSLETSPGINQDSLTTLADTRTTLTSSLDKLYGLNTSGNELTIPVVTPLVLEIGDDVVPKVDSKADGGKFLFEDIPAMRERIEKDTGVKVTGVRARGLVYTEVPGQFIIQLDEVPVFRGSVKVGKGYCPALYEVVLLGVPIEATAANPWTGEEGCWVSFDHQDKLREANLELWTETLFIIHQLEVILRRNLFNFLGIQEVKTILEQHANTPGGEQQIASALPDRQSRLQFARLLRTLVKENIRITNVGGILQTAQELQINSRNIDEIVRQVRLRNTALLPGNQSGVQRFELPGHWEEMLNGWVKILDGKTKFTPPPNKTHELIQDIDKFVPSPNRNSVLVVQHYQIRSFLRRLLENRYPDLMVMAAEELDKTAASDNKSKD